MASWELLLMAKLVALLTVSVILSLTGLSVSVLVKLAVLVITVPSGSGRSTVAAKPTVTGWPGVTVRLLARVGGAVPGVPVAEGVREHPGLGLALATPGGELRLGSRRWCGLAEDEAAEGPELWLTRPGRRPQRFAFIDPPREDAAAVVAACSRVIRHRCRACPEKRDL